MIWGPFLLALALGLVVSAGLYFAYLWPQVEPDDDAPEEKRAVPLSPPAGTAEAKPDDKAEIKPETDSKPEAESTPEAEPKPVADASEPPPA